MPFVMGDISPLTFRFGPRREFEAGYVFGALAHKRGDSHDPKPGIKNIVEFTYLLPTF